MGISTLAALGAAPEQLLVQRFGPNLGRELRRRGHFQHDGEIGAARKVVSESRERTFDTDVSDAAQMREHLSLMAEELCAGLAAHGRRGRTIGIKVRLDDWTTVTRARTLAEPTCNVQQVSEIALRLLREYSPTRPVRLLGVRVAGLGATSAADAGERDTSASSTDAQGAGGATDAADQLALPV
jgi:DNA polymerase IV